MAAMTVRWQATVLAPSVRHDEGVYLLAFAAVVEGRSPYDLGSYFYSPVFALAGAWAYERFGDFPVLVTLRVVNLLGMAAATWCAAAWMPGTWRRRLAAAVAFVCLSPAARLGVLWGNLSLLVVGMAIVGLTLWRRRTVLSGVLLGLSVAIKPIAPVAVGALAVHRPSGGGRRQVVAGGLGLVLAAVLLLAFPYLGEMLSFGGMPLHGRNAALHHVLACFGLEMPAVVLAVAVALAVAVYLRRRALTPAHLANVAGTAAILATPVVWSHTLLLVLPLEVMALGVAFVRRRALTPDASPLRRYEATLVVLAVLAIQMCEGLGGIEKSALWIQGLAALPPVLAPAVLAVYVLRHAPDADGPLTVAP